MLKKASVILLVLLLAVSAAGCGTIFNGDAESPSASGESYSWNGISLKLQSISDEFEADPSLEQPSGKYVEVILAIQDDALSFDQFQSEYKQLCSLTCGEDTYWPTTLIANGVEIRVGGLYAVGTLKFYFDLPEDADISGVKFAMLSQPVTKPAE